MSDYDPDFIIMSSTQDVIDNSSEELGDWWGDLGEEQRLDYLSAWEALAYGDSCMAGCYHLLCVGSYNALGYVRFQVTVH